MESLPGQAAGLRLFCESAHMSQIIPVLSTNRSQNRGLLFVPITESHFMGEMPLPGRFTVMLSSVSVSPRAIGLAATMLFRATSMFGRSDPLTCFV